MDRLIKTAVQQAGIPLEDVSRMASETPSRLMGVYDRKGSLEHGKDADIMMFDADLNLTGVVQMGREIEIAK
jgi:N-acetylglucosamine-6-phosphate deacetylase